MAEGGDDAYLSTGNSSLVTMMTLSAIPILRRAVRELRLRRRAWW